MQENKSSLLELVRQSKEHVEERKKIDDDRRSKLAENLRREHDDARFSQCDTKPIGQSDSVVSCGIDDVLSFEQIKGLIRILENNAAILNERDIVINDIQFGDKKYSIIVSAKVSANLYKNRKYYSYSGNINVNCSDQRNFNISRETYNRYGFSEDPDDYDVVSEYSFAFFDDSNSVSSDGCFLIRPEDTSNVADFVDKRCVCLTIDNMTVAVSPDYRKFKVIHIPGFDHNYYESVLFFDDNDICIVNQGEHEYELSLADRKILSVDKKKQLPSYSEYEALYQFLLSMRNEIEDKKDDLYRLYKDSLPPYPIGDTADNLQYEVSKCIEMFENKIDEKVTKEHELQLLCQNNIDELFSLTDKIQEFRKKLNDGKISEFVFTSDELKMIIGKINRIVVQRQITKDSEEADDIARSSEDQGRQLTLTFNEII